MKESQHIEFKKSFSDELIISLVAFANTSGGTIYVGVSDDGNPIEGFTVENESIQNWLNTIKTKTEPSIIPNIDEVMYKGMQVVAISVQEFPIKPVSFKGRYYKRLKNSNHRLSLTEISDMNLQSLQLSWDAYFSMQNTIEDLDLNKVEKFIQKVNTVGRFTLEGNTLENLTKLKLIRGEEISNAASLLFAKEGTIYNVHLGRFKSPSHIIDDKMLRGTLFEVVEESLKYFMSHMKIAFEITGVTTQRTEILEYPLAALRELLINSIIHRDYLSPVDVQIKIFDQSITFFNPGKLFGNLTIEDLKTNSYQAYARNKLIAEAFYLTGDIEKYGSGFQRIREAIKDYPTMKLICKEIPNGFLAEISYEERKLTTEQVSGGVNGGVSDGVNGGVDDEVNALLKVIEENPGIKSMSLKEQTNVSQRTIERWLKQLRDENRIEFIGAPKTGGYFIKKL